jgi:hypothetical protein
MKGEILLELAAKWERDATYFPVEEEGNEPNKKAEGHREAKRECADAIRMLVSIMGD